MGPFGRKVEVHIWLYAGTSWKLCRYRWEFSRLRKNAAPSVVVIRSRDNQQGSLLRCDITPQRLHAEMATRYESYEINYRLISTDIAIRYSLNFSES